MRLVPITVVQEGCVLGQTLTDEKGRILLQKGVTLRASFIDHLRQLGYTALYIQDQYTTTEVDEILRPQVVAEVVDITQRVVNQLVQPRVSQQVLGKCIDRLVNILDALLDNILDSQDALASLLTISDYDQFTYKHSLNCMVLAVMLGDALKLDRDSLLNLAVGSVFHDMGKLFIPKEILLKPKALADEEMTLMRKHPREGYQFLKKASELMPTARIMALEHHEKWDGSGYPAQKKGQDIYLHSRIAAVCDVFEALTANRPYRPGQKVSEARSYVIGAGGTHFDLEIVKVFADIVNPYPVDTLVRLSDGREGVVRKIEKKYLDYPEVEIFYEQGREVQPYVERLVDNNNVTVEDVIHQFSAEAQSDEGSKSLVDEQKQ